MGEKKQKICDPNFIPPLIQLEKVKAPIDSVTSPTTVVNSSSPRLEDSVSNPLPPAMPNLQPIVPPTDPSLSFQIPYQTWTNFILQFKALEHKVEELTLQVAVLSKPPTVPFKGKHPSPQVGQSGSVDRPPLAPVTQTLSTCPPKHDDATPLQSAHPPQGRETENSWQIQLSKRDKKAATTAAPAPAGTAQPYPFLKAVIGDSTSPCSRQSSCNCSRCMVSPPTSLVPVRPLKTRHQDRPPHHPRPQPPLGGETSSKVQPTRSFREKIAAIESSNELLDRLLARVQDSTPLHHKTESRAVSSIYFSCRLTKMGRRDPLFSLRKIFQGFTEVSPLESNLVSHSHDRSVAEIFLPEEYKEQALQLLPETSIILSRDLSYKDVRRRAASYNRSYFRELRRASLTGLSNQLQLEVLATAEAAIPRLPEGRRKAVSAAILSDRQWVLDQ